MVLATKNPLNILSTMGIFAVQLLVLGGHKALPAPYTAMWHGSWVLIWRRCHWVTTLLVMMILAYVTGTHTIILDHFGGSLSSNSSTSSLFLSLSLLSFFRGVSEGSKCWVISFIFHSARSNHPILITIDITFVRHRCCPPRDPETRVPQPPTSFSQQHLRSRLYQMFLDGLGQKSASNV